MRSILTLLHQLVKTSKLTGDAECPPDIQRAHEIEKLMNEKAGSPDLDDGDIVDASDAIIITSNNKDDKPVDTKVKVKKTRGPIAQHPPTDRVYHSKQCLEHKPESSCDHLPCVRPRHMAGSQ